MKRLFFLFLFLPFFAIAQKKPLDHTVYDAWQSIGERMISHDGRWVLYTITPQEGDALLEIRSAADTGYVQRFPRGYNAQLTDDSRFAVFRIRPYHAATREARIKKKRPEDFPKDSLAVVELGTDRIWKAPAVRSYKLPRKAGGWVAYHRERDPASLRPAALPTQKTVDSLRKTIDSLLLVVKEVKNVKAGNADGAGDAEEEPAAGAAGSEGTDLVLRHLKEGREVVLKGVAEYYFDDGGRKLLLKVTRLARDPQSRNGVVLYDLQKGMADTLAWGGNDFRNFALTEDGSKAAFVAERDTSKALQKFYQLYLYTPGQDSARLLVDKHTPGMKMGMAVSEHGTLSFSRSGNRLLFGTAPIPPPKDTSLVEIDLVKLDIWHYNDDYLQTQQLFNLQNELKRTYLAVYDFGQNRVQQIGSKELPTVLSTDEGDGPYYYAVTDTGRRVAAQWSGQTLKDIYAVDVRSGNRTLVKKNHLGQYYPSATGRSILLYDAKAKHYFLWNGKGIKNITAGIRVPLYNEEHDTPSDPAPYGLMGWHQNDSFVYVYDRYNVWRVDPEGRQAPWPLFILAPKPVSYRYISVEQEERFIRHGQPLFFRMLHEKNKNSGIALYNGQGAGTSVTELDAHAYTTFLKARDSFAFVYSKEAYGASPDLYFAPRTQQAATLAGWHAGGLASVRLTRLNPQQSGYNWGTAALYHWTTLDGKPATGILYKPEDFDPAKKYPMLIYFYEKLSDGLHQYIAPAPTPSRLNIPFFVSRGYLVFAPDISYTKGRGPGRDAYNYIVSGAQALAKNKWVDAKNIGIQGQSWGGYQVAHLITRTNMFRAAWAGAPVVNMTSAYGGIRWESGVTRQFQYEKGQSRIGATVWERPDLYIENSPLFHLPKVNTPLVIMSNDADGAVPWQQGIEMFTAMRRLGKKVWMLNYNGEAHNLVERKNRKDIQVRQQEYFDWLLKGDKPARWITQGVPAVKKGRDWGLELVDEPKR